MISVGHVDFHLHPTKLIIETVGYLEAGVTTIEAVGIMRLTNILILLIKVGFIPNALIISSFSLITVLPGKLIWP